MNLETRREKINSSNVFYQKLDRAQEQHIINTIYAWIGKLWRE